MPDRFFTLSNVAPLSSVESLKLDRARDLADAIEASQDFTLLQLYRSSDGSGAEYLVVDVECHAVPGRNRHGILCPERALFAVPADPTLLVNVHMLRKDFPLLMHQNQATVDRPATLCLYYEAPPSVLRTWTPQRFLQRILWWLEKSAKDELHPADQPVEGLFFATPYELVLPWNYDALRLDKDQRLVAVRAPARPDGGVTCFVEALPKGGQARLPPITHVSLDLPPIVHGTVEPDPFTLGELADMLQRRGVELFTPLRDEIRSHVGTHGAAIQQDTQLTAIVLNVPIRRSPDEEPSANQQRAFLATTGGHKLGESMGALFQHQGKYFNAEGIIGAEPKMDWRGQVVMPMAVLRFNDSQRARFYSGVVEPGPNALLVGAGSLGSAMLNLWGRSGWGQWTVIDKDHVKPHNLARHVAYAQHVGNPKSQVVADLHKAMSNGASDVAWVCADATAFRNPPVSEVLKKAALAVDASTTLEYPRAISAHDTAPRHISTFITPNGNSAVLLAEDASRQQRLRTLEAQYYRAIIGHDWGGDHLEGARTFWSGASCRDISYVLPYARIQAHASVLAEQVPLAWQDADARIRVWQRNPGTGEVVPHTVSVHTEKSISFGKYQLFIDEGVEQSLREQRLKALPKETGGVLLGYYDFNVNAVIIVAGLPAPPDSKGARGAFERGIEGLSERIAEIGHRTAGVVGYVGEWHSHPRGHSSRPSGDDLVQLAHLATRMADEGLPAVQLIVGEKDISVLQGVKSAPQDAAAQSEQGRTV